MVYVTAVLLIIRFLCDDLRWRIVFATGLLALGSSQLWFGHVENYSWVTATAMVSIAWAIGYLQGRIPLWLSGAAGGLAISFHPQAIFIAPALLCLIQRKRWLRQIWILGASGLVAPVVTLIVMRLAGAPLPNFGNGYAGDTQLFWTMAEALNPGQLMHDLDNLLLVAPLSPLWFLAGIWAMLRSRLRHDRIFLYLTCVAAGLLVYQISFQNDLPRWRDWDLFAIAGPGITLWGLYASMILIQDASLRLDYRRALATTLAPALVFAGVFTSGWVGVNHDYILLRPRAGQQELYRPYRALDLMQKLGQAHIAPTTPICAQTTGCERVTATTFTMPQNGDRRPVIFAHAPAHVTFSIRVPKQPSFLWLSPALDPVAWDWGGDGVTFQVSVAANGVEQILWSRNYAPNRSQDRTWHEALIPLNRYRGQTVDLTLTTLPGPMNNDASDRAGWGLPWLMIGTPDLRFP